MFILRSTHEKLIHAEKARCEAVVAQMQEQISDLRKLVFMPTPTQIETLPIRTANAILDGQEVMPQDDALKEAEMREANRILSGEYSNSEEAW
jgi:hypothetical protein